jgi:NitT/TauT family transport system permease protein
MPTATTPLEVAARAETLTDAGADLSPTTLWGRSSRVLRNAWVQRILSVVVVLVSWQLVGANNPYTTSSPVAVYQSGTQTLFSQVLPAFGQTLATFGVGFAICILAGIPIGLAMARIRVIRTVLEPYVNTFYSLPMVSLFPVLLLAFGVGFGLRVAATVLFGLFAVVVNTFIGASSIDPALEDTAKVFVASPWKRLTTVILPASLSYIFAGIRISFGHGMIGAVVIEIEASAVGIGSQLKTDASELQLGGFFLCVVVLGIFSILAGLVMRRVEHALIEPWTLPRWMRGSASSLAGIAGPALGTTPLVRPQPVQIPDFLAAIGRGFKAIGRGLTRIVKRRSGAITLQIVVLIILLALWQLASLGVSRAVLPSPISVIIELGKQIATGSVFGSLGQSLLLLVTGFVCASVIGTAIGLAMGQFRWLNNVLDPWVSFLYALPHAVFIPIFVVWLGFGFNFGLGYVIVSAVFPPLINAMQSVRTMKEEYPDLARSFNASRWQTTRTIIWPHAIPYIVTGVRLAFSVSWIAVIVSEVLSSEQGLGGLITTYGDQYLTADMFVPVVLITVISVAILQLTTRLAPRLTPWAPSSLRAK